MTWLTLFLFLLSLFLWEGLIIWAPRVHQTILYEGFETSHTVDLPINTSVSCKNICGPQSRCSITCQQCTSDIDCYGCQPKQTNPPKTQTTIVRGQNDAGKLGSGVSYSSLTTDIGTKSKTLKLNITSPTYQQGINHWRSQFDSDKSNYDKSYGNNTSDTSLAPTYPVRQTLTGEFQDVGPLAANDYL